MTDERWSPFIAARIIPVLTAAALWILGAGSASGAFIGIDGGYVGSDVCGTCHTAQKADFDKSGHPYKYRHTGGATPVPETDPISAVLLGNTPLVSTLNTSPAGVAIDDGTGYLAWSAADYVVGGFGWKARWGIKDSVNVDGTGNATASNLTGYVWSSTASGASGAQYNMLAWGPYDPLGKRADWSNYGSAGGQTKAYNCAVCHNTNGTNAKSGDECTTPLGSDRTEPWGNNPILRTSLPGGFKSEWTFDSVQCEACHGAGETHANAPSTTNISKNTSLLACGQCHTRHKNDEECFGIEVSGGALTNGASDGFLKHHEQYNEMVGYEESGVGKGVHADLTCVSCHDPHKRSHQVPDEVAAALGITDNTLSAKARGAVTDCASCHEAQKNATGTASSSAAILAHTAAGLDCIDCHMAEATKSATGIKGTWGKKGDDKTHIFKVNPSAAATTVTDTRLNSSGKKIAENYLSTDYACGKCHDPGVFEGFGTFAAGSTIAGPANKAEAETSATNYHNVTGIDGGYVGSDTCSGCHTTQYSNFIQSGHPYKYRATNGETPTAETDPLSSLLTNTPLISTLTVGSVAWDPAIAIDRGDGRLSWSSIDYVIGGFGWKARWGIKDTVNPLPSDGSITGIVWGSQSSGTNGAQFNILAQDDLDPLHKREDWSKYGNADGQTKKYECAVCHNTNGTVNPATYSGGCGEDPTGPSGHAQPYGNNPGMDIDHRGGFESEWTFDSVQCEACHGPAKDHVANPTNPEKYPEKDLTLDDCGKCHTRAADDKECYGNGAIGALTNGSSDGFIKHHEQYNELVGACVDKSLPANGNCTDPGDINLPGVHASLKCQDCHDPHKRAHKVSAGVAAALNITDNDLSAEARGAVVSCESCHPGKTLKYPMGHKVTCVDCHMGEATKSATGEKGTWGKKGDDKTHIFKISPTEPHGATVGALTNVKGKTVATNYLTLDYVCGKCHDPSMSSYVGAFPLTTKELAQTFAANIHNDLPTPTPTDTVVPTVPPTATPTPTLAPTDTPTLTPTHTSTLTPTNIPTATDTPTNTVPPTASRTATLVPTATRTSGSAGENEDGGCNIVPSNASRGSLLWLILPAGLIAARRRASR